MSKRIGYVRVSTADQSTARQLDGVQLDKVFEDKASGKTTERPKLKAALDYLRDGDTLIVHSMDRLARNTEDLLRIVRELTAKAVTVEFIKERMTFKGDSHDPMQTLMMTMLGAFAQFERTLINERQREGIAIAKANGVYKGRKPSLTPDQVAIAKTRIDVGESVAAVARELGISRPTMYAYLKAAK